MVEGKKRRSPESFAFLKLSESPERIVVAMEVQVRVQSPASSSPSVFSSSILSSINFTAENLQQIAS